VRWNPIRELADVRQISTYTLRLVSANTPAANYGAELTEVADGSPTLVQPTVTTAKGMEFIPFSIEIGEDWQGLQQELLKLLNRWAGRARRDHVPDWDGVEPAARSLQRCRWVADDAAHSDRDQLDHRDRRPVCGPTGDQFHAVLGKTDGSPPPDRLDVFYRYVAQASTTDPLPFTQGRGGPFLGTPKVEWSTMSAATTVTGSKVAIVGDWSGFVIADRVGASVELIPHLFGSRQPFSDRSSGPLLLLEDRHGRLQALRIRVPRVK